MEEKIQKLLGLLDTPECYNNPVCVQKVMNVLLKVGTPAISPTIHAFRACKNESLRWPLRRILVKMGKSILPDLQVAINDEQDTRKKYVLLSLVAEVVTDSRPRLIGLSEF